MYTRRPQRSAVMLQVVPKLALGGVQSRLVGTGGGLGVSPRFFSLPRSLGKGAGDTEPVLSAIEGG